MNNNQLEFKDYSMESCNDCIELFNLNCPEFFASIEKNDYIEFLNQTKEGYVTIHHDSILIGAYGVHKTSSESASQSWTLIHPKYQNQGIGRLIMERVFSYLESNQLDNLFLSTSQQTEAFFLKFGAIRIDYIENGWDEGLHRIEMKIERAIR